jgi:predicted PurR-regulated permease PerM
VSADSGGVIESQVVGPQADAGEAAPGVAAPMPAGRRSGDKDDVANAAIVQQSLIVLAVIAVVAALYLARGFFVPLAIGILTSYSLRPMVDWLHACRIPRAIGAALVLLLAIGCVGWVGYSVSDDASVLIERLPDAARKLRQSIADARAGGHTALQSMQEAATELQGAATDVSLKPGARVVAPKAPEAAVWLRDYALAQSGLLASVAAQAPIVLLLAYFLLASGEHFRRKLVQFVGPSLSRKKDAVRILEEIEVQVQRYLLVMLGSNVLVAISTWLAFEALDMPHAGVWGVAAGVLHFVPYLGPALVVIGSGVVAFLQSGSALHAVAVAGTALLVAGAIGHVFMTWMQSRAARLSAAVLFIALLFMGWLWGMWGLLLGAPLLAIIKVICDRVDALKPLGELLGR